MNVEKKTVEAKCIQNNFALCRRYIRNTDIVYQYNVCKLNVLYVFHISQLCAFPIICNNAKTK